MPAKQGKHRRPRRPVASLDEREGFGVWGERYLEWLAVRNYSPRTVGNVDKALRGFIGFCEARGIVRPAEVTKPILERYQRHLFHYRREKDGRGLGFRTQQVLLTAVRGFFRWLARQNVIPANPASELELPRKVKRLPGAVLTAGEVEHVFLQIPLDTAVGFRDRAMLEVLYATGLRRSELLHLKIFDLDFERGTIFVRQGKGKKDRILPISERARSWVKRYLDEVRPSLSAVPEEGWLFLTTLGERPTPELLTQSVHRYVKQAELGKSGSCHLFRHTMATLMLEGGADLRSIQEMLGHASLESTEVYTRISVRRLQAVYEATHPAAKIAPLVADSGEEAALHAHTERRGV